MHRVSLTLDGTVLVVLIHFLPLPLAFALALSHRVHAEPDAVACTMPCWQRNAALLNLYLSPQFRIDDVVVQ